MYWEKLYSHIITGMDFSVWRLGIPFKKKSMKIKLWVSVFAALLFACSLQAQATDGFTWQDVHSVNFGEGANHFTIEGASAGSGGEVELRLDTADGPVIGRVFFHHTGSSTFFMDYECSLSQTISGIHDVYMNFLDYTEPDAGGILNIGDFQFAFVDHPSLPAEGNLHAYPPVPGLDPSPYYTYQVQKVSDLNASNLEDVTNWETPFAWFTQCPEKGDPNTPNAYYSNQIGSWSHTYCNFEMDPNTPIVVKITRLDKDGAPSGPITAAAPHPADRVEKVEIINGDVYVTMRNPAQVAIDIDGQLDSRHAPRAQAEGWDANIVYPYANEMDGAHAVTIFANPFITDKPDPNAPGVMKVNPGDPMPEDDGTWTTLYFMPGIHKMSVDENGNERAWHPDDVYKINSNRQYYIPGDAIVYGNFNDKDPTGYIGMIFENIRFFGHGTISGAKIPHWKDWPDEYTEMNVSHALLRIIEISDARNVVIEGITSSDQAEHGIYLLARNLNTYNPNYIKWVKMIGWRVNTDGMGASGNSYVEDSFIRGQDDAFYVNGMGQSRIIIWADVNGAPSRWDRLTNERGDNYLELGLPKDLVMEDINIIYARSVFAPDRLVIGGGGNIGQKTYSDGTLNTGQHIVYRNLIVEDSRPQRLLIGSAGETEGRKVRGVRLENINYKHPHAWGRLPSLKGLEDFYHKYWVFDNVNIAGEKVNATYLYNPEKFITEHVSDITFRLYDTIPATGYTLIRTEINGVINFDLESGAPGEVTLTAVPLPGYEFTGWSGNLSGTDNPATITMDSDKSVIPIFSLIKYAINTTAVNGNIILDPADGPYLPGTDVAVTADGDLGYGFDEWGGDLSGSENPTIITVDSEKNISATFKEVETYTLTILPEYGSVVLNPPGGEYNPGTVVTLTPEPNPGYYFEQWMGDIEGSENPATIMMDADKTVSARFVYAGFGKTSSAINFGGPDYEASDGTIFTGNQDGNKYSTTSDISGTEDDPLYQTERYGSFSYEIPVDNGRYQVILMFAEIHWSSAGSRIFNVSLEGEEVISNLDIYAKVGKNAAYNETHEVTVTDGEINIALTTVINNAKISAVKIVSNEFEGDHYTLTTDATDGIIEADQAEGPYPAGSNVLLNAIPDPGFVFSEWSGDLTGSENPVTLYMNGNKNVSANFVETNWYTLTTNASNGTIAVNPPEGTYGYAEGTEVTLTAIPDERYMFTGWSDDLSGNENPVTIIMDANKNIAANFVEITYYNLSTEAANGSVLLDPPGGEYSEGTVVTLTANPNAGYIFKEWSGDITGSENPVTITMDADKNVIAEFENPNALTLTINSENGTVQVTPAMETYRQGTTVILVATPNEGYEFAEWQGDLTGSDNPVALVIDTDKNIMAVFNEIPSWIASFANNPAQTILMQNYPNPFSTETTIQYQLSKPSDVKITVYNMMGQQVALLVDEYQVAGTHSVKWVAKGDTEIYLHNGLYIYRLETGNNTVLIKKASLIR